MRALPIVAVLLLLAACAGPTAYAPAGTDGRGFADSRLETGRYLVTFRGNALTPREDVERALLNRAAEVTLDAGGDWFVIVSSDTEVDRRVVEHIDVIPYPTIFAHRRFGFRRGFGPRFGFGFGYGFAPGIATIDRDVYESYEATAEIFVRSGTKPEDDPAAYDARDVIASIGPTLERPEEE